MTGNDNILLQQNIEAAKSTAPKELDESQIFGFFTVDQVLKDYDLSNDEIVAGLMDGNGDGGIDGLYIFADENLVDEDFDSSRLPSKYSLEIYIFQDKQEVSFSTKTFDKLLASLPDLLTLDRKLDPKIYSSALIQRVKILRDIYKTTARKFPKIVFHVIYAAIASTERIDHKVTTMAQKVEAIIPATVGAGAIARVSFQGSRELLNLARKEPSHTLELPFTSQAAKTGESSYVALAPVQGYADFLSDGGGKLKKFIFESNVRDFQGNTLVNKAIRDTLASSEADHPDFWWLNNGVTILATEVSIAGGKFIIKDPQIVNGLQTSVSIYNHFKDAPEGTKDERLVLVKIIESNDEDTRNSVIIATNSQTNLLPTAIRAADNLQRDIEEYFKGNGFYYDRRKNFYKNLGKSAEQIFAVPYLAQAVLSIGFSEPDQARARPSTLIANDTDYERIFDREIPMNLYLWMAKLQRETDKIVRQLTISSDFKTNMKFHLSMLVGANLLKDTVHHPSQLKPFVEEEIDYDTLVPQLAVELDGHLAEFLNLNSGFSVDRAAKSKEFVKYLIGVGAGTGK